MKLQFGCGHDKIKGYINCDISPQVNPDKIVDLEKTFFLTILKELNGKIFMTKKINISEFVI